MGAKKNPRLGEVGWSWRCHLFWHAGADMQKPPTLWRLVAHREPPLGCILGLIDFKLRVSLVAEDLFELEHLTRPVIFKQDHLDVTVCLHGRQGGAQFANRHRRVLTHEKDLHAVQVSSRILPHPMHTRALSP